MFTAKIKPDKDAEVKILIQPFEQIIVARDIYTSCLTVWDPRADIKGDFYSKAFSCDIPIDLEAGAKGQIRLFKMILHI